MKITQENKNKIKIVLDNFFKENQVLIPIINTNTSKNCIQAIAKKYIKLPKRD